METICCCDDECHLKKIERHMHVLNVLCGFRKDDIILRQIRLIQRIYKSHFKLRTKSATILQARIRGWILRLDKFLFDEAVTLIQKSAKSYLQLKKRIQAATTIQKCFRTYNLKILLTGKKLREYIINYQEVCNKNKNLSNIILKIISKITPIDPLIDS